MRNRAIGFALGAMLLALCSSVEAQQPKKFFRIGVLFIGGRDQPHLEAFKQGLRELGYTEDKNITFEYRYAEGKEDRLPGLAAELVHLKTDVIVVTSDVGAKAVQQATKTLPIVVTTGDPVASGLADSLAKPGGNVTGLSVLLADLSGKRVEILRETLPKLTRLATLWNPAERVAAPIFKETSLAAQALSLQLHSFEVQTPQDIEKAFVEIPKVRADALLVILSPLVTLYSKRIVEMALKQHLPGMSRPEIKTAAQLKGGSVAIANFGGQADFLSRIALQKLGLNPLKDVTIVQIGTIPERLSALATGKVQAAMPWIWRPVLL